jgi:hypothetical protein
MKTSTGCGLAITALAMMLSPLGCGGDDSRSDAAPGKAPVQESPAARSPSQPSTAGTAEEPAAKMPEKPAPGAAMAARRHARPEEIAELPDNFPDDVPVYPESSPTASLVSGERDFVVSFNTDAEPAEVLSFYKTGLGQSGWRIESEADLGTQSALVSKKDHRTTTILVMAGPSQTYITVTIATE